MGGACKHVVATLPTLAEDPGSVAERPALSDLLGGLGRDALAALLAKRAAIDPGLVGWIEADLAAVPRAGVPPDPAPRSSM